MNKEKLHILIQISLIVREAEEMSKKDQLDPKSQKIHQNWTRIKHQKSQVNGETEMTLHNQLLRTAAKSKQF